MNYTYSVTYRRRFWPFKKTIRGVSIHSYYSASDKLIIRQDAGIVEIRNWSNCEIFLGEDWKVEMDRRDALQFKAKLDTGFSLVPPAPSI